MGRLLDEDDVIDAINKRISVLQKHPEFRRKHADIDLYGIKPMIAELPSAQPSNGACLGCCCAKVEPLQQREKGHWIKDGHHIKCNKCGTYMCDTDREGDPIPMSFCPNCGTPMERGVWYENAFD